MSAPALSSMHTPWETPVRIVIVFVIKSGLGPAGKTFTEIAGGPCDKGTITMSMPFSGDDIASTATENEPM